MTTNDFSRIRSLLAERARHLPGPDYCEQVVKAFRERQRVATALCGDSHAREEPGHGDPAGQRGSQFGSETSGRFLKPRRKRERG